MIRWWWGRWVRTKEEKENERERQRAKVDGDGDDREDIEWAVAAPFFLDSFSSSSFWWWWWWGWKEEGDEGWIILLIIYGYEYDDHQWWRSNFHHLSSWIKLVNNKQYKLLINNHQW